MCSGVMSQTPRAVNTILNTSSKSELAHWNMLWLQDIGESLDIFVFSRIATGRLQKYIDKKWNFTYTVALTSKADRVMIGRVLQSCRGC